MTTSRAERRRLLRDRRKGRAPPRWLPRRVHPAFWFLLRFAAGWAGALLVVTLIPDVERWAVYGTVASLKLALLPSSIAVHSSGCSMFVGSVRFDIVPDCTPLMPIAGLWAAVLAFPAPARWKLMGLSAGALVLWGFNVLRVLAIAGVMAWWPSAFEFVHVYLWQTVTLVVVYGLFILWIALQRRWQVAA